jgi:prophage regulatory protein
MTASNASAYSLLRRKDVQSITGLSRSTIYFRIAEGSFPKPISLGSRAVGWLASEIEEWVAARVAASRPPLISM